MRKTKGFTLIELMIVIAILAILAAIAWPVITGDYRGQSAAVQTGTVEFASEQYVAPVANASTCVEGFKYVNSMQVLDENGNGVKCEQGAGL